jgi:hypothetical protein
MSTFSQIKATKKMASYCNLIVEAEWYKNILANYLRCEKMGVKGLRCGAYNEDNNEMIKSPDFRINHLYLKMAVMMNNKKFSGRIVRIIAQFFRIKSNIEIYIDEDFFSRIKRAFFTKFWYNKDNLFFKMRRRFLIKIGRIK